MVDLEPEKVSTEDPDEQQSDVAAEETVTLEPKKDPSELDLENESNPVESADSESMAMQDAQSVFRYLMLFQAMLASFAHGANDTANATGPFMAIWRIHEHVSAKHHTCTSASSSLWIMMVAGFFVLLGIVSCGSRVIKTVGEGLVKLNYQRGYCVGFAATISVVVATIMGFPVSTTHCQVGAVVCIGLAEFGRKQMAWGMLGKICITWVVTLPLAAFVACGLYEILIHTVDLSAYR